ncbi:MAG: hypothetical protein J7K96_07900 [Desulfobacteraceae bacterium]|nr:hypothetical protein [Desulfobacteraceae bacterium]
MNQTINDKVSIIRESFQSGAADLLEVSGSFRVDFGSGQTVYIYVETYDHAITARFESKEADSDKRQDEIDKLRAALVKEIRFADISEFHEAQSGSGRFVYTASVRMDESVFFHETIVIGTDAPDIKAVSLVEGEDERIADVLDSDTESTISLSPVEEAIEKLETVDAKMLRQSLDMMNLKRSGNVRMALTRIFRSALGAAELTLSIHNEAIKLISQNDHEDLRMIKIINAAEFLEPVIGLLYEEVFGKNSE